MTQRIPSIDIVRGIAMVLMALDHVRDLFHAPSLTVQPTDLENGSPWIFLTRFVTHFCAPAFVFLAGTSAFLSLEKSGNAAAQRNFLFKRGLWLLFLEFTVVGFGIWFDIGFHTLLFQVIAAIGFGFILLGCCLSLPSRSIGIIGIVLLLIQTVLPLLPVADGPAKTAVSFLFFSNFIPLDGGRAIIYAYPILSWTAVLFIGFGAAREFRLENRQRFFLKTACLLLFAFAVLRAVNIGDIAPWTVQKTNVLTALSFLNVTKYPPTLAFCCLTLGGMFLILWLAEKAKDRLAFFATYGNVPLFYYLIHWYVIHVTLLVLLFCQGFGFGEMEFATARFGRPSGAASGLPLTGVYAVWIAVALSLYVPCRWYMRYKSSHRHWWLRYL